uniref:Uncharacterized protein n=1 Tax=Caenorhabditis tropicalis TaxID=1561998 RepID=A0A1I7T6A2_9PELO
MKVHFVIVVWFLAVAAYVTEAASLYLTGQPASDRMAKRSALLAPEANPDWNQLGWAWGKRSVGGGSEIPRRLVRALHPVKKNPDWNDLGFAWGRK